MFNTNPRLTLQKKPFFAATQHSKRSWKCEETVSAATVYIYEDTVPIYTGKKNCWEISNILHIYLDIWYTHYSKVKSMCHMLLKLLIISLFSAQKRLYNVFFHTVYVVSASLKTGFCECLQLNGILTCTQIVGAECLL